MKCAGNDAARAFPTPVVRDGLLVADMRLRGRRPGGTTRRRPVSVHYEQDTCPSTSFARQQRSTQNGSLRRKIGRPKADIRPVEHRTAAPDSQADFRIFELVAEMRALRIVDSRKPASRPDRRA